MYEKDKKKKQTEETEEAEEAEADVAHPGRGEEEEGWQWKDCQQEKEVCQNDCTGDKGGDKEPAAKARWTMTTKQKYSGDGWSEPGKKFYDVLLEAIKDVNFNEAGWQAVWEEF